MKIYCHGGTCSDKYTCTKFLYGFGRSNIIILKETNKENCSYYESVANKK
jgi:hypothetical protein